MTEPETAAGRVLPLTAGNIDFLRGAVERQSLPAGAAIAWLARALATFDASRDGHDRSRREREHAEERPGHRSWWRCVPITEAAEWEANTAYAARAKALDDATAAVGKLFGVTHPMTAVEVDGDRKVVSRKAVLAAIDALR